MLDIMFQELAEKNGMKIKSSMAYGLLNGCYVTLTSDADYLRISIYVGPQIAVAEGTESPTVSCANQIVHTITSASGADNIFGILVGHATHPAIVFNHAGSVVTVNFENSEERSGIQRFVDELLPLVAPLTRPGLCICCSSPTDGHGVPVSISGDTVVPMHRNCCKTLSDSYKDQDDKPGSILTGAIGALLVAILGAGVWAFVYQFGFMSSLVGLVIGFMVCLAYDMCKGKPGRAKLITAIVCCVLAILLGTFGGTILNSYTSFQELDSVAQRMFAEIGEPGWWSYHQGLVSYYAADYWYDIGVNFTLGLLFAAMGCFNLFRDLAKRDDKAARPRQLPGNC